MSNDPRSRGNQAFMMHGSGRRSKPDQTVVTAGHNKKAQQEAAIMHRTAVGEFHQHTFEKDKVADLLLSGSTEHAPALRSHLDASAVDDTADAREGGAASRPHSDEAGGGSDDDAEEGEVEGGR